MRLARLLTLLLLSSLCLSAFGQVEIQILPPQIWSGPSADTLGFLMPTRANNGAKWASNATAKAAILPAGTNGQTLRYNGTTLTASSLFTNDGTNLAIPGFTTPGYIANDASGNLSSATAASIGAAIGAFKQGGNSFTANGVLGTTDNYPMTFLTNNVERMRISQAGQVQFNNYTSSSAFSGTTDHFVTQSSSGQFITKSSAQFLSDLGISGAVTGSGASGRLALWNGTSTLTSDGGLLWGANGYLEVQPSGGNYRNFKVGSFEIGSYTTNNCWVSDNLYYDGNWKYGANGASVQMYYNSGDWTIFTAPSGTAGSTATRTARFIVGNTGVVQVPSLNVSGYVTNDASGAFYTATASATATALNYWTLNGGDVYRSTGNVSIGTSSTPYKFTIEYPYAVGGSEPFVIRNSNNFRTMRLGGSGSSDEGNLYLSAPSGQGSGCGITFESSSGAHTGLFQLDGGGNMVFRQSSGGMYYDYGNHLYYRRISDYANMMDIDNSGNLSVPVGNVTVSSGNLLVSAGNTTVSSGNLLVSAGNVSVGGFGGTGRINLYGNSSSTSLWSRDAEFLFQNNVNTNGTWVGFQSNSALGSIASGISFQVYDQSNAYGTIQFATRGASGFIDNVLKLNDGSVYIPAFTTANNIIKNDGSGKLISVTPASLGLVNFYTNDGTLTGNRTVTMGGNNLSLSSTSIGTASGEAQGLVLTNTTAAASSAPQNSSALVWSGQSWLTGSSASQNVKFLSHYVSQEGTSSPAGYFALESSLNGGAYSGGLFRVDVLGRTSIGNSAIVSGADLATSRNVSDPTADNYGFYIYKTTTKSTGGNQSATFGVRSEVITNSNNISDAGETIGVLGKSVGTSTGTSGTTAAASGGVFLGSYSGLGTASSLYGVRASVEAYRNSATVPVVTNAYGVYVSGANPGAGGLATVTNSYGLHIGTLLESTVNSTYSIYQTNSSYLNYLNGKLGLGTTGPDRRLDVLDASNPQLRLTYTDGSVYTDFKTTSAGGMEISPSGGRIDLIPGADGAVYNARRQVEAPTDVAMTGNATLTAGRKVYHLSGTISAGNTWTLTLPTSASMIDGEVIEIVNGITGVATATVQIAPNSGQDLIGGMSSLDFSNSVGAYNRKSIKLMFKTGGTWYALAQGNY